VYCFVFLLKYHCHLQFNRILLIKRFGYSLESNFAVAINREYECRSDFTIHRKKEAFPSAHKLVSIPHETWQAVLRFSLQANVFRRTAFTLKTTKS
jgi:hypothetical protein